MATRLIADRPGSVTGCRAADKCPFLHEAASKQPPHSDSRRRHNDLAPAGPGSHAGIGARQGQQSNAPAASNDAQTDQPPTSRARVQPVSAPRAIVARPTPRAQTDDPREFQLAQVRRRFTPSESTLPGGSTALSFKFAPGDPDFAFDLAFLECVLTVPAAYPRERPSLRVTNVDMPRGYQINVEKGFSAIALRSPNATLLHLLNALDRELESFLTARKADTVKIVANVDRSTQSTQKRVPEPEAEDHAPVHTPEQLAAAKAKREADVRQLVARMGRLPLFKAQADRKSFTIPVDPRKRDQLPEPIRAMKFVSLDVPELYNLEPCHVRVEGLSVEQNLSLNQTFEKLAVDNSGFSLVALMNYLAQNLHTMISTPAQPPPAVAADPGMETQEKEGSNVHVGTLLEARDADRPPIVMIPRPPEWSVVDDGDDSSEDSASDESNDESEDDGQETDTVIPTSSESRGPERGIMLSFPHLELHGIELLELVSLGLTVKCERCKDLLDVTKLRNNETGDGRGARAESCKKCASSLSIGDLVYSTA